MLSCSRIRPPVSGNHAVPRGDSFDGDTHHSRSREGSKAIRGAAATLLAFATGSGASSTYTIYTWPRPVTSPPTGTWTRFTSFTYTAGGGDSIELYVYQATSAVAGDAFDVDGLTLFATP